MNTIRYNFKIAVTLVAAIFFAGACGQNNQNKNKMEATVNKQETSSNIDTATFGGGCFWCVEAIFQQLNGVISVESGYSGGTLKNPSYKDVCGGNTGHAEVIRIIFDKTKIKYDELLEVFWKTHDPTTPNQQGADIGTQYRSVIFYHNEEQKKIAEKYKEEINKSGAYPRPIVTEISPITNYYKAEDYHQNYYNQNKEQGYCRAVIQPKLDKFEKIFKDKMKKE